MGVGEKVTLAWLIYGLLLLKNVDASAKRGRV
jgi:hypothetical protein